MAATPLTRTELGSQAGFSLIEMTFVVALMMVVVVSFFGVLQSLTNSEERVNALVTNQETVRFGLDQMQRDLRAANPVDAAAATASYANVVQVELGPNPGTRKYIRWLYDTTPTSPTYKQVLRQVMSGPGANATVTSQGAVIIGAQNVTTATPVFSYYDAAGNDLVANNPTTPTNVANCVIRIHVQIIADSEPGPAPFSENINVELRNRLPGGIVGCS
jgi:type II secretory pathway pseudopilin PulG